MGECSEDITLDDVEQALQWELADLKVEYEATAPHSTYSDTEFANREADICRQFSGIGRTPSYPPSWTGAPNRQEA